MSEDIQLLAVARSFYPHDVHLGPAHLVRHLRGTVGRTEAVMEVQISIISFCMCHR